MYEKNNPRAYLYLVPALVLLAFFMIYPLIDVFIYSFEEGYSFVSKSFMGYGFYNYHYVLQDTYFLQALKNTLIMVIITVPLSTIIALLIAYGITQIKGFQKLYQTIFFLPYVTNTIAVGLVFLIMFDKTPYNEGFVNLIIKMFGGSSIDFIDGTYAQKMFVMCFYIIWVVMPYKILVLVGALSSVPKTLYDAARVDQTSKARTFRKITIPMISPMLSYLVITGFIGAFKEYNNAVALFGTDLDAQGMNTIVGYVYSMLYNETGGYPSYASAAAIILFLIVLTITCINLLVSRRRVFVG